MTNTTEQLYGYRELIRLLSISRRTLYQWIADGKFPRPIKHGGTKNLWRESDVRAWQTQEEKR